MAKKIIIQFNENPVPGTLSSPSDGFQYGIYIDGLALVYNSGLEIALVNFVPYNTVGENTDYILEVFPTLEETILNVFNFLYTRYIHPSIIYSIVGNTIEVSINVNEYILINFGLSNINIETTSQTIENDFINLKYFFQYKNIVNDEYICRIYKKNYVGNAVEIHGKAIIEKGNIKNHLDPIRGGGLSLELAANTVLTLEDLYTENEQDFSVKLFKNGKIMFYGYVNPEGLYQSFTRDSWTINLDCVDGLGSLSNLSFVDPAGFPFIGKMKPIDIIYYCLLRSGISLPINTSINTFYDGLIVDGTTNILNKIYLNADRFQKIDNDTIMSCEEVLKSILDLFSACITQQNGEWHVFKPNELSGNAYVEFKKYDIDNVYVANVVVNLNKSLGSNIDNFYPHHCSGDQNIQIQGSISKYRINYKYGFVSGILPNPKLIHDSSLNYNGWTILRPAELINDPTKKNGFIIKDGVSGTTSDLVRADPFVVALNDLLSVRMSYTARLPNGSESGKFVRFKIQVGIYYLKYEPKNNESPLSDAAELAVWTTDSTARWTINIFKTGNFDISIPAIPIDGNLILSIIRTIPLLTSGGTTEITLLDVFPTTGAKTEVGEFHTVERAVRISSNVKDVKTIYNGDNSGIVYLGAIFKQDQITPTETWSRKGKSESYPLLRIASEEELRISQMPLKIFKGSIYGFIPYLSVITINNINNKFMFLEYSYDTMTNMGSYKLLELFSSEIQDIIYKFTLDYGNTVKPTITS